MMNSFIEFINRVPLLIESILVVLVPSSQQVYANTYTNEELENDELIVKTVSSDEEKDFVFADSANTKYILETKGQEVATANFDKLQGELNIAIEEYEAEQAKLSRSGSRSTYTFNMSELAGGDVWSIANGLVGTPGNCFYICQLFIQAFTGEWNSHGNIYQTDSPSPGDLIYYANGGMGAQHWAIYLGGDQALHGNYNGTTVIRSIYLKSGSSPVFYKLG